MDGGTGGACLLPGQIPTSLKLPSERVDFNDSTGLKLTFVVGKRFYVGGD